MTPYHGKMMKTTNMCDNDKHGTPGAGELRVGGPVDNQQKQPLQDSCLL